MHIAILMTNTDESDFAQKHPKDGEKFQILFHELRPDWSFSVFNVKDDQFPEDHDVFDGFLITGSPASVNQNERWIERLEALVRKLHNQQRPIFGACFGHQIIAKALGGKVETNPKGWVLGTVKATMNIKNTAEEIRLYAAHKEQVTKAPKDAITIATASDCQIAGFIIENHIVTTQYHPEMTPDFIDALVDELEKDFDPEIIKKARKTLAEKADRKKIARLMVEFFEATKASGNQ